MDVLLLLCRLLLAAVLGVAGVAKLLDLPGSRQAMIGFGLPAAIAPLAGFLLPAAEIGAALLLLFPATAWLGAWLALALLVAFIGGISVNLARGRTPDCHCFGQLHSAPIGWPTLARNAALAIVALWLVWQGQERLATNSLNLVAGAQPLTWFALTIALLAVAIAALEGWFLLNLLQQNGRLLLRVEALEAKAGVVPTPAPAANILAIGSPAPAFSLPGHTGETLTLNALRANNKLLLLLFLDPGCGPCNALLPEVAVWQRDYADKLNIVPITRGVPAAARAAEEGLQTILIQKEREVAEAYKVVATPSALLVRPDGTVGSAVAGGAEAIRALLKEATGAPQPAMLALTGQEDHDCNCGKRRANGNGRPHAQPNNRHATPPAPRIGTPAPIFQLPNLHQEPVNLATYQGEPTLLLFWNPGCGYCRQMLPDLQAWEANPPAGAPRMLLVSTGTVEANQAQGLNTPIVLDTSFDVASSFGARGTPSAVLVDAEGQIASEVAVGRDAVLALASRHQPRIEQIGV